MSSSKARFQKDGTTSKVVRSSVASSSKRTGAATGGVAPSGFGGSTKPSQIQVIHQGKIVTPQSLLVRKSHTSRAPGEFRENKYKATDKTGGAMKETIDEAASDGPDSKPAIRLPFKKPQAESVQSESRMMGSKLSLKSKASVVEETATIILSESSTNMLLCIPSVIVASDTRDVIVVDEKNARYEAVVQAHKNVDGFTARPTQTKNNPIKNQNEMAAPNALRDFGSQATSYDIKDSIENDGDGLGDGESHSMGVGTDPTDDHMAGLSASVRKFVTDTVGVSLVTPGCLLDPSVVTKPRSEAAHRKRGTRPPGGRSASTAVGGASKVDMSGNVSGTDVLNSSRDSENEHYPAPAPVHKQASNRPGGIAASSASSGNDSDKDINNQRGVSGSRVSNSDAGNSDMGGSNGPAFTEEDSLEILREQDIKKILSSDHLLKRLHMVERAIQQNANHRPQLDYRDLPDIVSISLVCAERVKLVENNDQLFGGGLGAVGLLAKGNTGLSGISRTRASVSHGQSGLSLSHKDSDRFSESASMNGDNDSHHSPIRHNLHPSLRKERDEDEKVKKLFSYTNPELIQGRSVTAMVFNVISTDLLAVGYGKTDTFVDTSKAGEVVDEERRGGLVLFWSLRNPDYPEKLLRTAHPVTALDFSKQRPMILAVGLINGDVVIYDVKREGANWSVPVETSARMSGGHCDPVWQLKWIVKGVERLETLISISTDGSVLEWNLKKGLVVSSLMQLKKSGTGEGWISNSAAGLSFDFHPLDSSTYITGTEEGSIYRCSVSYNEQYLETYQPHEGPVYRVRFSTRWPSVFLTCSADWSVGLYHLKSKSPLLTMRATGEDFPVTDVCWCPGNSTVFACATVDAKVQIWDLSVSSIEPVVTIDTCADDEKPATDSEEADGDIKRVGSPNSAPGSPVMGGASRFFDRNGENGLPRDEDSGLSAVNRLIKKLTNDTKKKTLTSIQFGDKTPTIVVGDNRGTVTVYRIFDPVTITHQGPLQQTMKLKAAIKRLTDPSNAAMLESADNGEEEAKG